MNLGRALMAWLRGDLQRAISAAEDRRSKAGEDLKCLTKKVYEEAQEHSEKAEIAHHRARENVHYLRNLSFKLESGKAHAAAEAAIRLIEDEREGKNVTKVR